jgi:MFS family permease
MRRQPLSPVVQIILVSVLAHIALTGSRFTTSLYALSLGASEFTVGALIALFAVVPTALAVWLGRLIDRVGMRKPVMAGCFIGVVGCLLPALISGLPVLYIATVLIGTGGMVVQVAAQQAVGAMSNTSERSAQYSRLTLAYSVANFCGPLIAGLFIDFLHHGMAFGAFAGFAIFALLAFASGTLGQCEVGSAPRMRSNDRLLDLLRDPALRPVYLVGTLITAAWDLFVFAIPIHGTREGLSASSSASILAAFSLATFAVRLAMPFLARRFSEWWVITATLVISSVCLLVLPFMSSVYALIACATVLGLALGASQPNLLSLLSAHAPKGRAAEAVAIRITIINASHVTLPLAFGAASTTIGLLAVYWMMGGGVCAGVPFAWKKAAVPRREPVL